MSQGRSLERESVWLLSIQPWLLGSPAQGKKGQAEARQRNPMSSMGHSEEWLLFETLTGAPCPWGVQWDTHRQWTRPHRLPLQFLVSVLGARNPCLRLCFLRTWTETDAEALGDGSGDIGKAG